jgi:hypothetical protein
MLAPARFLCLAAVVAAPLLGIAQAAEDPVVAVVAIDGYADLKKQLGWLGQRVGNPQLAALAESFVMMATQFKGLAGLDVNRPAGVIVTAAGDMPVVHGYMPVKDLGKLLDTLQGVIGPAAEAGGKRVVTVPGGPPLEITEADGWAIIAPRGSPAGAADAAQLIAAVAEAHSIGVKLFPSQMPAGMRDQLKAALEQASDAAAAQGQPVDAAAMNVVLDSLAETESLMFGLAIDLPKERVFVESRTVMLPGSPAAGVWENAGRTGTALSLPAGSDGKPAAVRAHHAQAVPAAARPALEATLVQALPAGSGDPITDAIFGLAQDLVGAMLDAGGLEAALAIDPTVAKADALLPAVTLAARIRGGPALEAQIKNRFGKEGSLPPEAKLAFDTGRAAGANLHELTIDISGLPGTEQFGDTLAATLAVTADRVFLLAGGDVAGRVAAAVAAGAEADQASKPISGVDVAVPALMAYAGELANAAGDPAGDVLADVAAESADKANPLVQLLVQPIERGLAMRLSAEAGAIETIAAAVTARARGVVSPAGGGFPPLPAGAGAPALAP